MDMNDILNKWDSLQKKEKQKQKAISKNNVSHKKANAPTKDEKIILNEKKLSSEFVHQNEKKINPMELWLRRYGVVDKDKITEETQIRHKQLDRNYIINMKPEAKIDLHGLTQEEAYEKLNSFITECKFRKLHKILVIHGKGIHTSGTDPVLGELVRKFIEQDKRCGSSGHPKSKSEGGNGATWVVLK